jgi:hypothetical protein
MADSDAHGQPDREVRLTPLVFGVAFVAIGVIHLTGALVDDTTWVWVIGLTALAVAGLISAVRS